MASGYLLWPGTKRSGLEPLALLNTSFWDQKGYLPSMGLGLRAQSWLGPCLTAGLALLLAPGPWDLFLGQAGAIFGIGLGLWAGFRCSNVNRRKWEQMAGGFQSAGPAGSMLFLGPF